MIVPILFSTVLMIAIFAASIHIAVDSVNEKKESFIPYVIALIIVACISNVVFSLSVHDISHKEGYEEGYKIGQVDYLNGKIQYKPTTQTVYEKIEPTK